MAPREGRETIKVETNRWVRYFQILMGGEGKRRGAIKKSKGKKNDLRKKYFCEGLGRSEVNNKNNGKRIATTFTKCILAS